MSEQIFDQTLVPVPEQGTNPIFLQATKAVEEFRKSYEEGDEDWKHLLTETFIGEQLQAMYLGLKPLFFYQEQDRQIFMQNHN